MKRLALCVMPFFAVSMSGMELFSSGDASHKKFIDSIYDDAGKSLQFNPKPFINFETWNALFDKVITYVKKNDTSINDQGLLNITLANMSLKDFFNAPTSETTAKKLASYELIRKLRRVSELGCFGL